MFCVFGTSNFRWSGSLILAISKVVAVWILVSCGKRFSSSAGDSICCLQNHIRHALQHHTENLDIMSTY